jgi:hypothetical protein
LNDREDESPRVHHAARRRGGAAVSNFPKVPRRPSYPILSVASADLLKEMFGEDKPTEILYRLARHPPGCAASAALAVLRVWARL